MHWGCFYAVLKLAVDEKAWRGSVAKELHEKSQKTLEAQSSNNINSFIDS